MPLVAGTQLGQYEIRSPLGAGGMGEVYLARDTKLERTVALKVLSPEIAHDNRQMGRFVLEAKAASALSHPNVAHIYEIDEAEGVSFIAMEYVEGQPLDKRIGGQPLMTPEIVDIAAQIADALDEAHSKRIVHRDIKPSNIVITPRGRVKVLDFGLAKVEQKWEPSSEFDTQVKTNPGMVLGTVPYMSPEQAQGKEVDNRTDIWSLGVLMYQMATGRLPFASPSALEMIDRIVGVQPKAVSHYNADAPAELERIIRKCLEKERARRYQSASDLLVDLNNLKRDDESGITRALRPRRSRRAISSLAVLPLVNVGGDPNAEYLSDGITESIIESLSQLPRLRVMARSTVFRYKGREADPQEVGRELGVQAVLAGRVQQQGGRFIIKVELVDVGDGSRLWGEQYNRAPSDIFEVQEEIAREISKGLRLKLSGEQKKRLAKRYTDNAAAYTLYLKGIYQNSKWTGEGWRKGAEYFNRAIEADPSYALAYAGLASSYVKLGLFGAMPQREAYPKARAAATKALQIDEMLAEAHGALGFVKMVDDWDWPGTEGEYKRAIELNPNYADVHKLYGYHLIHMCRFDEAIREMQRAVELDPLSLEYMTSLGDAYYYARRFDEAADQLWKALDMEPGYGEAHLFLARTREQQGRLEEAVAGFRRASELTGDVPASSGLGRAYALSGKTGEARAILSNLQELSGRRYVDPTFLALIHMGLGETDEAFAQLERAYADHSAWMIHLKAEPMFDSIRTDARFENLMRRVGLL
jgi:serine/threonine protein kinase/Tfp pilus assembly protein PilF